MPRGYGDDHTRPDKTPEDDERNAEVWHEDRPRKPQRPAGGFIPIFDPPRAPRWRSWLLIIVSAVTLVMVTALFERHDKGLEEQAEADNVSVQARQAASLMSVEQEYTILRHMRELATSPSATRRVATTWAALDRGDGTRILIALSLMERIPDQVAEGYPLGAPEGLDVTLRRAFMYPLDVSQKNRTLIRTEVGWPAKLLFVRELPPDSPAKTSLYQKANIATTWAGIVVTLALLAGAIGLILLARFWMGVRRREIRFSLRAALCSGDIYLEAASVYLACFALGRAIVIAPGTFAWISGMILQIGGSLLAIFWPALRGVPLRAMWCDLGVHRGEGWWTEIRAGLVGYCAVLPFFAVGVVLMFGLKLALNAAGFQVHSPMHPDMVGFGEWGLSRRLLTVLLVCCFAPMTEELIFRGALFRGLRERWSFWPSAWISALVFAAIHPQGFLIIPPLAALALGFAGLREWRDSLVAPALAHALHNGTLILLLSLTLR